MKDETRIITNALLSYLSRGVGAVVGICMVPYLLHRLGEQSYGVVGLTSSMLALVSLIDMGVRPATSRQFTRFLFAGEIRRSNELASTALGMYSVMAILVVGIMSLAATAFLGFMQVPEELIFEGNLVMIVVSLSLGTAFVGASYGAVLTSQLRYDVLHITEMVGILLRAGFIIAVFSLWEPRLFVWGLAAFLAAIVILPIRRWQAHRLCPTLAIGPRLISRRGARDLMGFAAYTSVVRLSAWVDSQSGPLIISYFLGAAAVAHYTPAAIIVLALEPLTNAFLFQLQPIATRAHVASDGQSIRRLFLRSTRYSLLVGGGATTLLGSMAFPFVAVWLGAGFLDTSLVLLLWCATGLLRACVGGAVPLFTGTGNIRAIAFVDAALAVVSIGTGIYLVGWMQVGVVGAACGMLLAQLARTTIYLLYARRVWGFRGAEYAGQAVAGPAISLAVLAGVSLTTQAWISLDPVFEVCLALLLSLPAFAIVGWKIGLDDQDRVKARGYLESGRAGLSTLLSGRSPFSDD